MALPSRVELVSKDGGGHDGDGDGLHRLEDGGEERTSPVDAPDLQSERDARRHQALRGKTIDAVVFFSTGSNRSVLCFLVPRQVNYVSC